MFEKPKGPFCQSCGMPLENEDLLGTNNDESKNEEYCIFCFREGAFVLPEMTLAEMLKKSTAVLAEKTGMPSFMASTIMNNHLKSLKRWKV